MGAEIDRLEVKVEAQATKANNALDSLITKLEKVSSNLGRIDSSGLTGFANGIDKLAKASAGLSNVKTADFTRLTNNIQKLSSLNTNQIYSTASSMTTIAKAMNSLGSVSKNSMQVAQVAKDISKLGGANVQKAVTNLPLLTKELKKFMSEMSKAPSVSNNTIRMTNALARLASQGNKVGSATKSMSTSFKSFHNSARSAKKSTWSLASAFGKFYATYFLVIRGMKKFGEALKSSMNYIEEYNYFNVTAGKIASEWSAEWQKYGYASAENYADSFEGRISELLGKMTGFQINKDGTVTGIEYFGNLGLDVTELTNYSAGLMQVTNSLGLTGEASMATTQALTMLAGDISSFRNVDLKTAMTNLQSGLIGQSRALYKYGIDITNATLQTYAYKYGIEKAVSEMTQGEKMQLRTLAILDQSKVAWGDLANTLESPSNQLRLLQNNFKALARTIGNIFLPVVAKVLPYINGLAIAIRRLFEWVGNLLGVDLSEIIGNSSAGYTDAFDDLADDADNSAGAISNADKQAKKLKNTLLGFDEINQLNDNSSDSSSGSSSSSGGNVDLTDALNAALLDYQSAWNTAFADMENKANDFADKIVNMFKSGDFEKIGGYISSGITKGLNKIKWKSVYKSASGFGTGLAQFLNGLITPDLFGTVGKTIAGSLNTAICVALSFGQTFDFKNFGESIASGINNFFATFDFKGLAQTLNTWVDGLEDAIGTALKTINWGSVLSGLTDFLSNLEFDTVAVIIGTLTIKKIGKIAIENALKDYFYLKLATIFGGITIKDFAITFVSLLPKFQGTAGFDVVANWIITGIEDAMDALLPDWVNDFIGKFVAGFSAAGVATGGNPLGAAIGALIATFPIEINWFGEGGVFSFEWTNDWFDEAKKAFKTAFDGNRNDLMDIGGWILEGIMDGFVGALSFIAEPIARFFTEIWNGICEIFGIHSPAKEMKPIGEYILLGIVDGFSDKVSEFNTAISKWFNENVKPWFTIEKWQGLGDNAKKALSQKWNEFTSWWNETGIYNWWNDNVKTWFTEDKWSSIAGGVKSGLKEKWGEFTSWWNETGFADWWNNNVKPNFTKEKWNFSGIASGLKAAWDNAIAAIKTTWNNFAKWLNEKLNFKWDSVKIGGVQVVPAGNIQLGKIPTFAQGGYPNTGELFMARENGITEMVGRMGNRTAVVNNDQITQAFANEIRPAMTEAFVEALMMTSGVMSNGGQEPVVEVTIKADSETIYNIVQKGKEKNDRRYHVVAKI